MKHVNVLIILLLLSCTSVVFASKILIGQGSTVNLGTGSLYSDTLEVENNGLLHWGSGNHQIYSFHNLNTAIAFAQSSYISVLQNWENLNDFFSDSGSVEFIDSFPISNIIGNTVFFNLITSSTIDKTLVFEMGSTQGVLNNLALTGISGNLLKIRSSSTSGVANLQLENLASQTVDYVDISYNHGIRQHIAPGSAASFNSIQGPGVRGWFNVSLAYMVPTLNILSLLALFIMVLFLSKKHINNNKLQTQRGIK